MFCWERGTDRVSCSIFISVHVAAQNMQTHQYAWNRPDLEWHATVHVAAPVNMQTHQYTWDTPVAWR